MTNINEILIEPESEAKPPMTLHDYWRFVGTDTTIEVCKAAGTSFAYFQALAYLTRPCRPVMFIRLRNAARLITPGIEPDFITCTDPEVREQKKVMRRTEIQASHTQAATA